jgi:hypothetical protein
MLKGTFCNLFLIALSAATFAQTYQPPTIPPASPSVQNFMRYQEIPVDISTGVPSINIPIFSVKSRKLELPISVSYHASGIKVRDRASIVGLGWVLNPSGFVNVTIRGTSDGNFKPFYANSDSLAAIRDRYKNMNNLDSLKEFSSKLSLEMESKDYQADRCFYKLPNGQSGYFQYSFLSRQRAMMPFAPLKIDSLTHYDHTLGRYVLDGFKITDETGTAYRFDLPGGAYASTDYNLTSIVSADKTDTIRLIYKSFNNNYYTNTSSAVVAAGDFNTSVSPPGPYFIVQYQHGLNFVNTLYKENILDSIISSQSIVKFNMTGDRLDSTLGYKLYRLTNLSVYDRSSGNQIQSFSFNQSYFGTQTDDNQRLRLDSISISGSGSTPVEKYRFKYDNTALAALPIYPEKNPNGAVFAEDLWGYFTGMASYTPISTLFIPDSVVTAVNPSQSAPWVAYKSTLSYLALTDKLPNYNYANAALIQEVQYPTGGKTVFNFEPNAGRILLLDGTIVNQGAGFRIHQITNYTDNGNLASYKTYQYDIARQKTISASTYMYSQRVVGANGSYAYIIPYRVYVHSDPLESLSIDNGPPVFYEQVSEYSGDSSNNLGKTVYTYETPPVEFHYYDSIGDADYDGPRYRPPLEEDRGNYTPHLLKKVEYKNAGGQYVPVMKTENQYGEFASTKIYMGMQIIPETNYVNDEWGGDFVQCDYYEGFPYCLTSADTKEYPYYMHHIDLFARQYVNQLIQVKTSLYGVDTSQQLITTTNYTYDTLTHLQPLQQWTVDSKGDTLTTKFTYPIDYAGTAVYDSMVARNIITPVVQQSTYDNGSFLQSSKTNFYPWTSSFIAPQTVESKTLSNSSETRLRFNAYDPKGNTLSVSKEKDIKMSYIWDYNSRYPVAEVVNADTGQIAYSSFEGDGKGNWNFNSAPTADYTAPTGKKIYQLTGSNNITKAGLSSGTTYIVSYWTTKGSAYSITGTVSGYPIGGRSVNGWKYFEHRITGQTTVTITGTGTIDELRLYPVNARMTTYTYEPWGVKSNCDANNRIGYYEYDYLNRLVLIRDQDNNILKKVCYNYAGQPESCQFFTNTDQSGNYYSQVCASGLTPMPSWQTVLPNTFTSAVSVDDANARAIQYGQQLANLYGDCQQTVSITGTTLASSYCFQVEFYNPSTGFDVWFDLINGGSTLGNIPVGTYEVGFYSFSCDNGVSRTYSVGCGNSTTNTDGGTYMTNITISTSCHNISVN